MIFGGLRIWANLAWSEDKPASPEKPDISKKTWSRRARPVIGILAIVLMTHVYGALLFAVVTSSWFGGNRAVRQTFPSFMQRILIEIEQMASPLVFMVFALVPLITLMIPAKEPERGSPSAVLKALNLCFASAVISITTVLNFSLATSLAILLGIPLSSASTSRSLAARFTKYAGYALLGFGWLFFQEETLKAVWYWEILSVWFAPFVCLVYTPLVLQAGLVCLLPQ
jgi:glycosylphosphatidylinositol transamidase